MLTRAQAAAIDSAKPCPVCKTREDILVEVTFDEVERTYCGSTFKQETRGTPRWAAMLCDRCQHYLKEPDGTVAVFASVHAAVAAWNERA